MSSEKFRKKSAAFFMTKIAADDTINRLLNLD